MLGEETPIPEAWLGRPVRLVFLDGASTEYAEGDLEKVNDRGIVQRLAVKLNHTHRRRITTHAGLPCRNTCTDKAIWVNISANR